ncbi:MAG: prepilin peptidase [Clostridia bacterium]|nr:prepilin peptidase [Clostridia bacterium]
MDVETFYYVVTLVIFAVVGLCVGSFLNVVIYRLPLGMNLATPPSHCPSCDHQLAWYDNIPLFSWLFLRGKCRYCGASVTPRYFLVELITALLWLGCADTFYGDGGALNIAHIAVCCLAVSALICMALIDAEHTFIPDSLQITLLLLGMVAVFTGGMENYAEKLYGFIVGGGFFLVIYLLCFPLFGREGLGFGDVKLMACVGLFLGWQKVILTVIIGVVYAAIDILLSKAVFALQGGKLQEMLPLDERPAPDEHPFAPYLVTGAIIALFFGERIIEWYLGLFSLGF